MPVVPAYSETVSSGAASHSLDEEMNANTTQTVPAVATLRDASVIMGTVVNNSGSAINLRSARRWTSVRERIVFAKVLF